MIYVGTDIVSIIRFKKIIYNKKNKFLNKIFTKHEQTYCNSKINSFIHYSGKFAAKEAVKKAFAISPVPGGVGPMTIACLLRNTMIAYKNSNLYCLFYFFYFFFKFSLL